MRHPEKVFIPYIVVEWGYNEKWRQVSPVDDCPPEMLRNVTAALVEAGYHPFAEDEEQGEDEQQQSRKRSRRSWTMLDPEESDQWGEQNVIWKHKAS